MLNLGNFQLTRRLAHGVGGNASYTLMQSMDNTPSLGGGGAIVAQNPTRPERRVGAVELRSAPPVHRQLFVELPFGPNRRWLDNGGAAGRRPRRLDRARCRSRLQSGTPFTVRVCGAASDVAQGTNCSLRADLHGRCRSQLSDPTVDEFFNTAAFATPPLGTFGNSPRNMIDRPRQHQLNGTLVRDIRLGGNRA